ncbi:hypothetical protein [Lactococcus formosensis]|uniref:hypothetical protein n=1 Tax=Lactococcus formosensis TaxID=1281486 RepID=UPI002434ABE3|nr:hypothetical protein [Lactococcus formosensis]MDG6120737.1 hypothetical protein [Lactococcus formosensis]
MFYDHLDQTILVVFLIIVIVSYFTNVFYQGKKEKEYHNDDYWKELKVNARSISMYYIEIVTVVLAMLFTIFPATSDFHIEISLERLSLVTFNLIMLKSMVEYFALKYLDKRR